MILRKTSLITTLFFSYLFWGCSSYTKTNSETRQDTQVKKEFKVLFVGNSLTYYNDLPKLVEKEATERGISLETKMIAKPNYAIVDHWIDGKVQRLIETKKFDYVIIQQGPSSQSEGKQMLINGGKKYSQLCK